MRGLSLFVITSAALAASAGVAQAEIITVRSGQVGGLPGAVGQPDDTVRYLPINPPGAPVSAGPFTPADFSGADTGPAAIVIAPFSGFWITGISDPAARWFNWGVATTGFGSPGSSLYAIPFFVASAGAIGGNLNLEYAVDDGAGDINWGGANPNFLYVNGVDMGYNGIAGNFAGSTFHSQFIPLTPGWNTLYLYQRDQGVAVSGLIFSLSIDVVVPTPGAAALLGLGGLVVSRRRRA